MPIRFASTNPLNIRLPSRDHSGDAPVTCRTRCPAGQHEGQDHHAPRQRDAGDELGHHDPGPFRLQGEGDQPVALAGLAGHQHDDDDRQEVAEHEPGIWTKSCKSLSPSVRRSVDHLDDDHQGQDPDDEPATGPGVERLAELDPASRVIGTSESTRRRGWPTGVPDGRWRSLELDPHQPPDARGPAGWTSQIESGGGDLRPLLTGRRVGGLEISGVCAVLNSIQGATFSKPSLIALEDADRGGQDQTCRRSRRRSRRPCS